jgi:hypothetical protein
MRDADPQEMELDPLARRCEEETWLFFHPDRKGDSPREPDPRYCFEIFRRALEDQDQLAWDALYRQFRPMVDGWVNHHPEFMRRGGETQDFTNSAFRRLSEAITPSKFSRFSDLKPLLAYLKACVHSAIVEDARKAGTLGRVADLDALPPGLEPAQCAAIDSPVDRMAFTAERREALWHAVNSKLQGDGERLVVHCLFELDLKPKTIFERYPDAFGDVSDIYKIRQRVLERLARDPVVQALAREHA